MTPQELQTDLIALSASWSGSELERWLEQLPEQCAQGLSEARYGDLPRWRTALNALPELNISGIDLNRAQISALGEVSDAERAQLSETLMLLHPWRKGPYHLLGVDIDTEWRSDLKWDRLVSAIEPLSGRRVLDVGCGNGYHCWRMLGAGAAEVIGIDPTPLFVLQFKAIQHFLQQSNIYVLPLALEQLPAALNAFDTVFSMGVLYHRRSPMDHLRDLQSTLRAGGQLVLETLVIEGHDQQLLVPPERYARMGNVWFLPSPGLLCRWLEKLGFRDIALIDVSVTSTEEQRQTPWMTFHSLADFLDPNDASHTIEGLPAPRRAIVTARA